MNQIESNRVELYAVILKFALVAFLFLCAAHIDSLYN